MSYLIDKYVDAACSVKMCYDNKVYDFIDAFFAANKPKIRVPLMIRVEHMNSGVKYDSFVLNGDNNTATTNFLPGSKGNDFYVFGH